MGNQETAPQLIEQYNTLIATAIKLGVTAEDLGLKKLGPIKVFHDRATALARIDQVRAANVGKTSEVVYPWPPGQPAQGAVVSYDGDCTLNGVVKQAPRVGGTIVLVAWRNGPEQWEPIGRLGPLSIPEDLQSTSDDITGKEITDDQQENSMAKKVKKVVAPKTKKTAAPKSKKTKKTAAAQTNGIGHILEGYNGPRGGSKTEVVRDLLTRRGGCTGAEVLEATGWTAVSMPAMAKACGLSIRKEKEKGSPTQYFGE
jgi:hypothetical protein